jgi:rSAM/selenodomain-associated transferase 1
MTFTLPQLLIFAKDPRSERVKTRLAQGLGEAGARRFYQGSLELLLREMGRLTDHVQPVLVISPATAAQDIGEHLSWPHEVRAQSLGDLGKRLETAFREAVGPCLVVGTDMPELGERQILAALDAMAPGKVVMGPCPDGGYYLLGTSEFHSELFRDMPWSTADLQQATRQRAESLGLEIVELEPVSDIDYLEDLQALDRRMKGVGDLGKLVRAVCLKR